MTKTAIEILSLGVSLAALLGTVVVVDWPLIREWWVDLKFQRAVTRWERSHKAQALGQARYEALVELHDARQSRLTSSCGPWEPSPRRKQSIRWTAYRIASNRQTCSALTSSLVSR